MKIVTRYFGVALLPAVLLFSAATFVSCTEEDNVKTELLSFGPSGVLHGEDISFIGTGLDKVTAIVFPVGVEVPKSAFKSQNSGKIVVTVPIETTEGKVTLKTSDGDIESKTNFGLTYTIAIENIPAKAKPGTDITITGQFLNYVKAVAFFDGLIVTDFVSQSRTELKVTVPLAAKTGPFLLTDAKEEAQVVEEALEITLPAITDISPLAIKHSENLTITGTDLDLVTNILLPPNINMAKSAFVSRSETELVIKIPNTMTSGKLKLVVPSALQVESSVSVTIILPKAATLAPIPASPGMNITLTGTDLDLVEKITFPGVATPVTNFVSQSATQIVVTVPEGAQNGGISFITFLGFQADSGVSFVLPGEDLSPLSYVIFDDELHDGWQNWSWGGAADFASNEQIRFGTTAIKKTYDGSWDGIQLGAGNSTLSGFTKFSLSIYGGPGTNGKAINVVLNNGWGSPKVVTVVEGEWTEFDVPWSEAGGPGSPLTQVAIQSQGWAGTIYVDKVGFK